jgi:hypothetical protein
MKRGKESADMPVPGTMDSVYDQVLRLVETLAGWASHKEPEAERYRREIEGKLKGLRRDHARWEEKAKLLMMRSRSDKPDS